MRLDQLRAALAMPHKLALVRLQGLVKSQARLLLFSSLLESGVAEALGDWRSFDELARTTGTTRPDYLRHVLRLGESLGGIEARGDRYRLKGRILRAAIAPDGGYLGFLLREFAHYHARLLRELPAQIAGGPAPDYLSEYGDLVAGASRVVEPFIEAYVDRIAAGSRALRILEIGCGSGVYLRRYAACHPEHHGIAIDLDAAVAQEARRNTEAWGIADRFDVLHADMRKPPPELDGPFDLVTSFQNVYYFDDEERRALFRDVRARLAPGGGFCLVSALSSGGFMFRYYDVVLNGTAGCHSFPTRETITEDLREAGFTSIDHEGLLSGPGAAGLLARVE